LASNITGSGAITMQGVGNLALLGSNSFAGAVLLNTPNGTLTLGNTYAIGTNSITVSNGTVVTLGTLPFIVGNGTSNQAVLVTGSGSSWTNGDGFVVGSGTGAVNNSVLIANGADLFASSLAVGTNGANFNNVTITNGGGLWTGTNNLNVIGYNASSNMVTVAGGGAFWNAGGTDIVIGAGLSTGNVLRIDGMGVAGGAIVMSNKTVTIGNGTEGNALIITNGGQLISTIGGGGSIGNGGSNNLVLVIGGGGSATSVWALSSLGADMTIGTIANNWGTGNVLRIDGAGVTAGAVVSNINNLNIGGSSADGVVITNGGRLALGGLITLGKGYADNSSIIVVGGTGNVVSVLAQTGGGNGLVIAGSNNVVTIGANGLVTNLTTVTVGQVNSSAGDSYDQLIVTNGGKLFSSGAALIGNGSSNNTVTVTGGGALWSLGGGSLMIGLTNGGNLLQINGAGVAGGASVTNAGVLTVGSALSTNNTVVVTNGGQLFTTGLVMIGSNAPNNSVTVMGNGALWNAGASNVLVGVGGGTSNGLVVSAGGSLVSSNIYVGFDTSSGSNYYNVGGIGARSIVTNGLISIGAGTNSGGSFNSLTVTNASLVSGAAASGVGVTIGLLGSNNTATVLANSTWNLSGGALALGFAGGISNAMVINSGGVTNASVVAVGDRAAATGVSPNYNSLLITNGGQLWSTYNGLVANTPGSMIGNGGNSNTVTVTGANSLWNLGNVAELAIGVNGSLWGGSTGNVLNINNGGTVVATSVVVSATAKDFGNQVNVNGGNLDVTNATGTGALIVGALGQGSFVASGLSTTIVNQLIVTNSGANVNTFTFNSGLVLVSSSTVISNGLNFAVGDGVDAATFQLGGGTHTFQNSLVISSNAVLTGVGNIVVAGGAGQTVIQGGGVLNPGTGSSNGILTNSGALVLNGGGTYLWQINDFNGGAGANSGWDMVQILGVLTNTGTAANPFTIDVNSQTSGNVAGLATNFNKDSSYTIAIASASGGVASFDPTTYALNLTGFSNSWDGVWSLLTQGNNLVLSYQGATNFVWSDVSGTFSSGLNWAGTVPPPLGQTNVVLFFGGNGSDAYTASNDLSGLVVKRIGLTNSTATTQYIIGNAILLAGLAPDIQQNGAGSFVISNNLVLASNLTFDGTNIGLVEVDGTISGGYSLIKTGSYALVLGGANTYTGQTTIAQGQLVVANAGALNNSVVNNQLTGGLVFSNLTAATLGGLTGATGLGLTNTQGAGLALTLSSGGWTYSGVLSGSGSLTKGGSGTGTLSGNSTYTGDTLVSGGTLTVSGTLASTNLIVSGGQFNWANTGALTNAVAVAVSSGGTVNFATSGTLDALTGTGNVGLNANTLQIGANNSSANFGGVVSGAGTLSKAGTGTFTWTGGNSTLGNLVAGDGWLVVSGATVAVTGTGGTAGLQVANGGTFQLAAGAVTASNLTVTTGGVFTFNGGTLSVLNAALSNGADFVVGNGSALANFTVLAGGTASFQQGLILTNRATLAGAGTVTVGSGVVTIGSGVTVSPTGSGGAAAALTVNGTTVLASGGQYLWNITNFSGTPGVNWDLLTINGLVLDTATTNNPFVLNITAASLPSFDRDGSYSLTNLIATSGMGALNLQTISLVLTGFANAYDGIWSLQTNATSLILNYTGSDGFVWNNGTGAFATNGNWQGNVAPPTGQTNVALFFGGSVAQQYTASNGLSGLVVKRITLASSATNAQDIIGNAITLGGVTPTILQNGTGSFVVSNNVTLAANTLLGGTGSGNLEMDGQISGGYSLTLTGGYTLVLGGANTYSGATVISNGVVLVANAAALASSSVVSNWVNGGVAFSNNVTAATINGLAGAGNIGLTNTAGAGVGLTIAGSGNFTYSGGLSGTGGALTKSGSGTETLSGTNTYTGATVVNGGTLTVSGLVASPNLVVTSGQFNWANTGALTNAVAVTVGSGGTVNFATDGTLDALTGAGRVTVNANTLQVGFNNATTNFAGAVSGAGTVSKVGTGTWTLTGLGNALGNVAVNTGTLALGGGSLTATNFAVTAGGQFALNTGTLTVNQATVSNGNDFVVGNGSGAARFNIAGGLATFQNNLLVTNSGATLAGSGTLVANGALGVVVQSGGMISPGAGSGPTVLTTTGTLALGGGGQYLWEINSLAGTAGGSSGWDLLQVNGRLTNSASSSNPFTIDLTSLTAGNAAGALANFNNNGNYSFSIATASGGIFTNALALNLTGFANAYDGTWSLALAGGTNLLLDYVGVNAFTWNDTAGSFSNASQWQNGALPPTASTNLVLYFGGSTSNSYTATNDLTGLYSKQLNLTNNAAVTQFIIGNTITLVGLAPTIVQGGSGSFVISNAVVLGDNVGLVGAGSGTLTLAGVLGGAGSLTQTGAYTVVLSGNNTNTGFLIVNGGTLQVGDGGTSGLLGTGAVTNNAQLVFARGDAYTIGNLLAGTGAVSVINGGTVTLSGANTFTANLNVTSGEVVAVTANSFGAGPKQIIATNAGNASSIGLSNNVTLGANIGFLVGNSATGILNQAGNNTVQGVVALAGDTAVVVANGGLTLAGAVTNASASNQNLILAGSSATGTIAGPIADGGSANLAVVKTDSGTWRLTGTNTYSGATLINGGTLQIGANGTSGQLGTGDVTNNANLTFSRSNTYIVTNRITGAGNLIQNGSGTTVLATNETYTGTTLVSSGTLKLNSAGAFPGAALTVNGGIFDQNGNPITVTALTGTGGTLSNAGLTVTSGGNFSGTIAGSGALTNAGGVLGLAGTDTYSGGTVVQSGTLKLNSAGAFPTATALTVNNGYFDQNGNAITVTTLTGTGGTLSNAGLTVTSGGNFSGTIAGSGALTNAGGFLVLSGTATYSGGTVVQGGTLQLNAAGAFPTATALTVNNGYFDQNGNAITVTTLTGTSSGTLSNAGLTVTSGGNFSGTIAGSGALTNSGATLTLSGANTFSGGATVASGVLVAASNGALGSGPAAVAAGATLQLSNNLSGVANDLALNGTGLANGGALRNVSGNNTYSGVISLLSNTRINADANQLTLSGNITNNAYNLVIGGASTTTVAGVIAGTGALVKDGASVLTLSGANTYSGSTVISNGTVQVGAGGTAGTLGSGSVTNYGNLSFNRSDAVTVANPIAGTGPLAQNGTGILTLTGTNSYTGATAINTGTLVFAHGLVATNSTVLVNVNDGLGFGADTSYQLGNLAGAGNFGLTNAAGAVTVFVGNNNASTNYTGSLGGAGAFTKIGSGALTLAGGSPFTGATTVSNGTLLVTGTLASTNLTVAGGQFNWANPGALPTAVAVAVASGGTVNFATDGTIDALTGSGQVNLSTNTLQVGFNNASVTFAGTLNGTGTVRKVGAGTWTLTGASTLGTVLVSDGTLAVSGGSLTATNFNVTTGGAFSLTAGTVTGTSGTIDAGAALAVGGGTARFSTLVDNGSLTVAGGSVTATNFTVTAGSQFALNSGTLTVKSAVVSNGADVVVGTAGSAATLNLLNGGTATFQNNLLISSNATLKGAANIVVAGGQGTVAIAGTLALGGAPSTLTITGTNLWQSGGQFVWDVNNFLGTPGSGYDWLNVVGVLSNSATAASPFTIDVTSLSGSTPGLAANFNFNSNYTAVIATGQALANFNTNIVLNLSAFQNSYNGLFQLAVQGTNLVLTYTGSAAYTWTDGSTNFSAASGWVSGQVPSVSQSNLVLYFGGATTTAYTAYNDLSSLVTKQIVLTNAATATVQTIAGNPFTFAGLAPELDQNGAGAFVISNNITLGYTLTASGSGTGTVTLAGNLSGNNVSVIKTGTWTMVLGGSNTYNGATVVQDGHLFIANSYGLSGSTLSNVAGAAVSTNAVVFTGSFNKAYLGGLAGSLDLGLTNTTGGRVDLVVGGNNQNTIYSGTLSGAGSLTKAGSGTLTLSGINTYSGDTLVNGGMLVAGALTNGLGGSGSSLGTGAQIIISGGTLRFGSGALLAVTNTVAGSISLNGGTLNAASLVNFGHVANLGNTSTIDADFTNAGALDATNGTLVTLGTLFNTSTGLITNSATLRVGATGLGWMTNAGSVVLNGTVDAGTINNSGAISGRGTLTHAVANSGLVSATNGLLTIAGSATGAGAYRAEAGATLSFNGGGQISSLFNQDATIRVGGGILTNLSAFSNDGTLALAGGTYQANVAFTNNNWLVGHGTFSSPAQLVNQGTIAANFGTTNAPLVLSADLVNSGMVRADGSALQVTGVFTNNGTLQFISSVGTYSREVVNNGAWLTDGASSSTFSNNFIITTNGYVSAPGGKYVFTADLFNQSTNNLSWNTLGVTNPGSNTVGTGTEFLFSGASVTSTQTFNTPGLLLTGGFDGSPAGNATTGVQHTSGTAAGFTDNFAIGQLWLTNTTLVLEQTPGVTGEGGLFVNDLYLFGGSQLVISNNMAVYFVNSNGWSLADITLLGNAQIHQLTGLGSLLVIPEPNVLLMWLCGGITVWAARRRRNRNRHS